MMVQICSKITAFIDRHPHSIEISENPIKKCRNNRIPSCYVFIILFIYFFVNKLYFPLIFMSEILPNVRLYY